MKAIVQLAPLGVALVVFAVAVATLLQQHMAIGTWLLAAFLIGHGLVHVMFAAPPPAAAGTPAADFSFDPARSWLVTTQLANVSLVRAIVVALVAVAVVGYTIAGLATVGLLVPHDLWPFALAGASAASLALMAIALMPGLVLGVAIDFVMVAVVVTGAWAPDRAPFG